jgi:hypothetical protein
MVAHADGCGIVILPKQTALLQQVIHPAELLRVNVDRARVRRVFEDGLVMHLKVGQLPQSTHRLLGLPPIAFPEGGFATSTERFIGLDLPGLLRRRDRRMKIVGLIQGPMGSTRFPGKLMMELADQPMLRPLVERLSRASLNEVGMATTTNLDDDRIAEMCRANGWLYFRGSEKDVLDRYYRAGIDRRAISARA